MNIKRKMSNDWPRIPYFLCLKFPRFKDTLIASQNGLPVFSESRPWSLFVVGHLVGFLT